MQIFFFYTKTFDRFKTRIAISSTEIYGASKTVILTKRNVEKVLNGPERRRAYSRAASERTTYKKEGK